MTLDEIVSDYICEYRERARSEMRFFEVQRSDERGEPPVAQGIIDLIPSPDNWSPTCPLICIP
jgi:hypothetical protein